jgi:hypothetical protein
MRGQVPYASFQTEAKKATASVINSSLTGNDRACACGVVSGESLAHPGRMYEIQVQSCTLLYCTELYSTVCLRMRDGDHVIYLSAS